MNGMRTILRKVAGGHAYRWPNGTGPLGWPRHDTRKHGLSMARHGAHCASVDTGTGVVPCLACDFGPQCRHGHDMEIATQSFSIVG
jgi:hypothetical protein